MASRRGTIGLMWIRQLRRRFWFQCYRWWFLFGFAVELWQRKLLAKLLIFPVRAVRLRFFEGNINGFGKSVGLFRWLCKKLVALCSRFQCTLILGIANLFRFFALFSHLDASLQWGRRWRVGVGGLTVTSLSVISAVLTNIAWGKPRISTPVWSFIPEVFFPHQSLFLRLYQCF